MGLLLTSLQEAKLLSPIPTRLSKSKVRQRSSPSEERLGRVNGDEVVVVIEDIDENSVRRKRSGRREEVRRKNSEDSPRRD
jgi:hypothetical protein